jgi:hypothetical protein
MWRAKSNNLNPVEVWKTSSIPRGGISQGAF